MDKPLRIEPAQISQPDWVKRPSPEDIWAYYPKAAYESKIQGSAMLRCRVSEEGGLSACRVISEGPEGEGFGRAALGMSGLFEMRPMTVNGHALSGGVVRIPVRFVIPKEPDTSPWALAAAVVLCVLAAVGFAALVLLGQRLFKRSIGQRTVGFTA
jgi:TonB family protein